MSLHPLSGSNLSTLIHVVSRYGKSQNTQFARIFAIAGVVLLRSPFSLIERLTTAYRLQQQPTMPAPIFIIGHWRSGTTHLYNILSKSPQFGYVSPLAVGLPWDILGLGTILQPLLEKTLPEQRFIDRIPVTPVSPQEDEIAIANMSPLSYDHGIYFPQHFYDIFRRSIFFDGCPPQEIENWQRTLVYFLKKIWLQQNCKPLLIKNPVYTARVSMLRELFPGAKFIHIYRNPYRVFHSMQNFYRKLFPELALQKFDHLEIDNWILETYSRMMNQCLEQTAKLPDKDLVEIRFEDLEANPMAELERMYQTLQLDGFAEDKIHFQNYLASVSDYQKNAYEMTSEAMEKVEKHWQPFLERWGYRPPVPK